MDISCSKFYPNWMKNTQNVGKFSFIPYVKYAFHFTNFMKLKQDQQLFVKNSYNKFLENQNNSLVPVTGSWIVEQT